MDVPRVSAADAVIGYVDGLHRNCLVLCEGNEVAALARAVLLAEVSAVCGPALTRREFQRGGVVVDHSLSFREAVVLILRDRLRSAVVAGVGDDRAS